VKSGLAGQRSERDESLRDLASIPGVGKSIAADLYELGIRRVVDLRGRDPEAMYRTSCELAGVTIDRCLLYVYRGAVYFASNATHEPEKLKWWNWKDAPASPRRKRRPHV
jgi:Pathogenicity locus